MELVNPEKDWTITTTLSTRQDDINVRIERRTASSKVRVDKN